MKTLKGYPQTTEAEISREQIRTRASGAQMFAPAQTVAKTSKFKPMTPAG